MRQSFTSSCIISQTKLRSAMDGWEFPNKNLSSPFSQKDSILDRDENKSFSASAAACGFTWMPSKGPSIVCRRYGAEKEASSNYRIPSIKNGRWQICILFFKSETIEGEESFQKRSNSDQKKKRNHLQNTGIRGVHVDMQTGRNISTED